jgi:hypothetical protein
VSLRSQTEVDLLATSIVECAWLETEAGKVFVEVKIISLQDREVLLARTSHLNKVVALNLL